MEKKELKFYEAPATEVVELRSACALLDGSVPSGEEEEPTFE